MPEESAGDRTEEATPRRRQQERERGRTAKSRDLAAAAVLLGGMVLLNYGGEMIWRWIKVGTERTLGGRMGVMAIPAGNEIMPRVYEWLQGLVLAVGPFLAAMFLVAAAANFMQVGFLFSTQPLALDLNKLNPVSGLKRIASLRSLMTLAMNMVKILIVAIVAFLTIRQHLPVALSLTGMEPVPVFYLSAQAAGTMGLRLALIFFILGVMDYAYQRYQFSQDIRMTKQEVKQEFKDLEGDPQIRSRRRQIQRQMAMQRMMQEVPQAEVVVRNPTHYAVALKFSPEMQAPEVIAKGMNKVALRIIDKAREHNVPVWQDKPLARKLYQVEIGETIPPELFAAVAHILGYVLKGEKRARYLRSMGGQAA